MGGYAAEKTIFNDVTTGASNDLKKATDLARRIVTEFGMSEKLGQRTFGGRDDMVFLGRDIAEHRDYCEKTAELIDQEISFFLSQAYQKAIDTIVHSREKLEAIVQLLLEKETLEREEFEALFA